MQNNGVPVSAAYNDGSNLPRRISVKNRTASQESYPIPKKGSIILYNEIIKWQDRKVARPFRGCGIVYDETEHLVFVKWAIAPGFFLTTSFPKTDFMSGLVRYVILKDIVYKQDCTYLEMDIFKLPDRIQELVI